MYNDVNQWWAHHKSSYSVQQKHFNVIQLIDKLFSSVPFNLYDIGAGTGVLLSELEELYHSCYFCGFDLSQEAILNKVCNSNIVLHDINSSLSLEQISNSNINIACFVDVLEHLPNPSLALSTLPQSIDYLLISVPNFNHLSARISCLLGRVPFQNKPQRGGHIYWFNYSVLCQLLTDSGWKIILENNLYPNPAYKSLSSLKQLSATSFILIAKRCA